MSNVVIHEEIVRVQVAGESVTVQIVEEPIRVVTVVEQGPPGPPGIFFYEDIMVSHAGQASVVLSHVPIGSVILAINGLIQAKDAFSVIGQTVSLPFDLDLVESDRLGFQYIVAS